MAIIDLDEFIEKKEKEGFVIGGKKFVVPEMTMQKVIEFNKLRVDLREKIVDDDVVGLVNNQKKSITLAIPDMTDEIFNEMTSSQFRKVQDIVNKVFLGQDEMDVELNWYRSKYEDEFRKNLLGTEEEKAK